MIYRLHLESGPMRRKTMGHVSNLVGCCVGGPTTDETLEATPDAIRRYLGFLAEHGEAVDPSAPFDLEIVEHVMEGAWIGNGVAVITTDTDPLPPKERDVLLSRYRWIHDALLDEIEGLGSVELTTKPERGRAIGHIVAHVVQADGAYLANALRSNAALNRIGREVDTGARDLRDGLREATGLFEADVRAATPAERRAVIPRGQQIGSLRRTMRRALEHGWEHLEEIERRLA
jgi:uncharacterized damage-inducible protein DinB/predicted RNase H-like HicB family nuclease